MRVIDYNKIYSCPHCHKEFEDKYPYYKVKGVPMCSETCWNEYNPKNSPTEIVIKAEALDISNVKEGEGNNEYRPTSWNEYKGQQSAKDKVIDFIKGSNENNEVFPHLFISGYSGMGKTLFATILANQLNKKIVFTTGGELKNEQIFVDKIVECDGGIIFVDEASRLNKRVGFFMLPLIEQFQINGKNLKKFTIIFSTTHKGDISKDLDALLQRCEQIDIQPYTNEELLEILNQYAKKQYPNSNIPKEIFLEIVNNCRQVPRNAKNLVRAFVYTKDWEKVKKYNNIVYNGLTQIDFKVLNYLKENIKGVGQQSISNYIRIKPQTYLWDIEPYLIYKELIEVTNRRIISEKGKELLKKL